MRIFFDTSVLVASLVGTHPHHIRALSAIMQTVGGEGEGYVSAHGLAETYAVLTTLPVSPRIQPVVAHRLMTDNVVSRFQIISLSAREYQSVLGSLHELGIMGGSTYDAIHAACARKAQVERLYTFNVGHFRLVAPDLTDRISAP